MRAFKYLLFASVCLLAAWVAWISWSIYTFSLTSSQESADSAIVLGAAVWDGEPSPVFEERIKHGINLYHSGQVDYLIFTGGVGDGDSIAESEVGKVYAVKKGVPKEKILIETESRITFENLLAACKLMQKMNLQTALIVSDPLHMRRAMRMAEDIQLDAFSSPTPTSRYKTWKSKSRSLAYETFFYIAHNISTTANFSKDIDIIKSMHTS